LHTGKVRSGRRLIELPPSPVGFFISVIRAQPISFSFLPELKNA
jgi:hypothetical protein